MPWSKKWGARSKWGRDLPRSKVAHFYTEHECRDDGGRLLIDTLWRAPCGAVKRDEPLGFGDDVRKCKKCMRGE